MTPWVLRRLPVVGGLVLAGWLLGSTGQAHADAGHGAGAVSRDIAIGSLTRPDAADTADAAHAAHVADAPVKDLVRGGTVGRQVAAPAIRPRGLVRRVVASAERRGDLIRRQGAVAPVLTLPVHGVGSDVAQAPRHSLAAVPGERAAAGRHAAARESGAAYRGDGSAAAAWAAGAMDTGRCGRAHARTVPATPAPPAGYPHRAAGETGALPSAGSAPAGGLAGHPTRPVAAPWPSVALKSVLGAVPPAVHAATDEPAISPD